MSIRYSWLFTAALSIICIWLGFKMVDQSVTLDHQERFAKDLMEQHGLLIAVLNEVGTGIPEDKVVALLRTISKGDMFEKAEGHIVADQVSFFFENGVLVGVK